MRFILGVLILGLLTWPLSAADEQAARQARSVLKGTWSVLSAKGPEGREVSADELKRQQVAWTFEDSGKAVFSAREFEGRDAEYSYSLDPSQSPKAITLTYVGPSAELKDFHQLGIYKLEKEKLTLCLTGPQKAVNNDDRPKEFEIKEKAVILLVLQRPAKK
jgi:uncharacterized protein (TIGR03067 family)